MGPKGAKGAKAKKHQIQDDDEEYFDDGQWRAWVGVGSAQPAAEAVRANTHPAHKFSTCARDQLRRGLEHEPERQR